MPKKFVLIDAHSIIFRSYFAFIRNPLKNSKGVNTSGVFGFLNTLEKIKKKFPTQYICLAFDAPGKTFRDKVFQEYKATRPAPPPDIPFQITTSRQIAQYLGLALFELEGYEADDILATFATQFSREGDIYIVSSDKDLLQLVSEKIFIYDAYRDEIFDRAKVIEKFGVGPERIAEYLALTGDSIDNVPGVPGIGPKRAVEILEKYHDLDEALDKDERLHEYKTQAQLARKLTTLDCHVPIKIQAHDLSTKEINLEKLMPILIELEFHSYIKECAGRYQPKFKTQTISDAGELAFGAVIGIAFDNLNQVYVCPQDDLVYGADMKLGKEAVLNSDATKIGYRFKDSIKNLKIKPPLFDLEIVAWLLDPNRKSYSFDEIILQNLNVYPSITEANVANLAFKVYPMLKNKIEAQGIKKLYEDIEQPLIYVLAAMEKRGIKIDIPYLKKLGKEMQGEIRQSEQSIYQIAGSKFNINSPKQLAKVLFEDLKLKPARKGKTHYSTDVEVLQQLSLSHDLPKQILTFRELTKINSTYIEPLLAIAKNGRVHTTFNQTGTATGRLSSSNPNIQNIPIRSEVGRKIRKGFIAEHGFLLVSADYSQIELRLLAHITKDKNLIQAFAQGDDIHNHTASLVFNIPEEKVNDQQRRMAKVVNYGLIYGMSDYGLAQGLDIPQAQATQFIESYYNLYPEVERWRAQAIAIAEEKGYTETMFGRRRPLPDIHSDNRVLREFSKRAAINTPIQGTAADLIKLSMIEVEQKLSEQGFSSGLILSIHDELLFEIEEKRLDEAKMIVQASMVDVVKLQVPVEISLGVGKNWDEAH